MTREELQQWIAMGNSIASEWWFRTRQPEPAIQVTGTSGQPVFGIGSSGGNGLLIIVLIGAAVFMLARNK